MATSFQKKKEKKLLATSGQTNCAALMLESIRELKTNEYGSYLLSKKLKKYGSYRLLFNQGLCMKFNYLNSIGCFDKRKRIVLDANILTFISFPVGSVERCWGGAVLVDDQSTMFH